jgi:CRP/FNR family transcriptional regulator
LSNDELNEFDNSKSCIVFKKGQTIFSEHAFPNGVYCIHEGKVKVVHIGNDGKEQIVRLLINGSLLGYRALVSGTKYTASAVAIEDSKICFIPKVNFLNSLNTNTALSMQLIKLLATELGHAEQTITDIAQKPVKERMAEALLLLREKYGTEADGATINVTLSREDIASLVGTVTETAIRLLAQYKHNKILALMGKKIKILDMNALVRSANIQY